MRADHHRVRDISCVTALALWAMRSRRDMNRIFGSWRSTCLRQRSNVGPLKSPDGTRHHKSRSAPAG